ncbi:MAG: nucleotidyltransferase domain-containing protein [Elusimicrobiota bacterium]
MIELQNLDKIKQQDYIPPIKKYFERVYSYFTDNFLGLLLYGSVGRGTAKPFSSWENDIDLLVIIEGLVDFRERGKQKVPIEHSVKFGIEAVWITPKELEGYILSKTGFIMDALYEGVILYEKDNFLTKKRDELIEWLTRRGVKKKDIGWVFPIKAGEKFDYR